MLQKGYLVYVSRTVQLLERMNFQKDPNSEGQRKSMEMEEKDPEESIWSSVQQWILENNGKQ